MDITVRMIDRGISTSYPYLSIARKYNLPYETVLNYTKYQPNNPWFREALRKITTSTVDIQALSADLDLAMEHFDLVQRGKIAWGK